MDMHGVQNYDISLTGVAVTAFGYPGDPDCGFTDSEYQYSSHGLILTDLNKWFVYNAPTCGGFSGGPIYPTTQVTSTSRKVMGIHSGSSFNVVSYGVRMTQDVVDQINYLNISL